MQMMTNGGQQEPTKNTRVSTTIPWTNSKVRGMERGGQTQAHWARPSPPPRVLTAHKPRRIVHV